MKIKSQSMASIVLVGILILRIIRTGAASMSLESYDTIREGNSRNGLTGPDVGLLHKLKRAIQYPEHRDTKQKDFLRQRRGDDYDEEYYSPHPEYNENYSVFSPYKNVGSLLIEADDIEITEPLRNFGVDKYPKPDYSHSPQ